MYNRQTTSAIDGVKGFIGKAFEIIKGLFGGGSNGGDPNTTTKKSTTSKDVYKRQEYGTRLVMMDRGNIILDKAGEDKKNTSIDDILEIFNKISIECGN